MRSIRAYTDVKHQGILKRKTGRKDKDSEWAKARVARAKMNKRQFELGDQVDRGDIKLEDCEIPPLFADAILSSDQSHMKAIPVGGSGHAGSQSVKQYRIAMNPTTGRLAPLESGGQMPERRQQLHTKFDSHAQGCYTVACPIIDGKKQGRFLPTYNYTGRNMQSAKCYDISVKNELKRLQGSKNQWKDFNSENPYLERYGEGPEIPENLPDWETAWLESQKPWREEMRNNAEMRKIASVKDFVLHLIKSGEDLYKGTNRAETWMIWHDALSILWDKHTQAWLRTLKCPSDAVPLRTWADRFVRLQGEYNDMVSNRYKNTLPGDSPELMPLDNHLFADIREGVARNVGFSFFLADNDPDKYSLGSAQKVFDAIQRTIAAGCPSSERIVADCDRVREVLDRIIEAEGTYIEDSSNTRHGTREVARIEELSNLRVDPTVVVKFQKMFDDVKNGLGLPFYKPPDDIILVDSASNNELEDGDEIMEQEAETSVD
jgi:hypothetical protein